MGADPSNWPVMMQCGLNFNPDLTPAEVLCIYEKRARKQVKKSEPKPSDSGGDSRPLFSNELRWQCLMLTSYGLIQACAIICLMSGSLLTN